MRLIIAGGRRYQLTQEDHTYLDQINDLMPITEIVSGGAPGADAGGEAYAKLRGHHITRFDADWDKHGRAAGPIRNRQMAEYADAVVLFPGGAGTRSMHREAERVQGMRPFSIFIPRRPAQTRKPATSRGRGWRIGGMSKKESDAVFQRIVDDAILEAAESSGVADKIRNLGKR